MRVRSDPMPAWARSRTARSSASPWRSRPRASVSASASGQSRRSASSPNAVRSARLRSPPMPPRSPDRRSPARNPDCPRAGPAPHAAPQALADRRREAGIGREDIALRLVLLAGDGKLLHRAGEEIQRPGPGVALVADEVLHQHQRIRRAVGVDAHDLAQQRRRVGEAVLGEVARHLAFGVNARAHAAQDFQHDDIADDERAVGLLGREPADLRLLRQFDGGRDRGRHEAQLALRQGDAAAVQKIGEHGMGECIHRESVGDETQRRIRRTRASASCCAKGEVVSPSQAMPSGST